MFGFKKKSIEQNNIIQNAINSCNLKCPEPFQIRCLSHELKFCNDKFRVGIPVFYIDVMRCEDFYDIEEIWQQKDLIDLGNVDNYDIKPEIEIYYPYHDPVFVRLHWWNDTYSGIVDVKAVQSPSWVKLTASFKDIEYETYKGSDEEYQRHKRRQVYMQLNDDEIFQLGKLIDKLNGREDLLDKASWKKVYNVVKRAELQRSL